MQEVALITDIFQNAVSVAIKMSAPMLIMGMMIGVVVAILQAVTQIHEQSIAFVLKLITIVLWLSLGGGWMLEMLQEFTRYVFSLM